MDSNQAAEQRETFFSFLHKEFEKRKTNNKAYSIRAFARDLGMDQSLLSKFLRGKADLNWKTIESCLRNLRVGQEVLDYFQGLRRNFTGEFSELEDDIVNALGCWKYWAILEFFKIDPNATFKKVADRFHFKVSEVEDIVRNLERLEFLEFTNGSCKILKPNNNWISNSRTSEARKNMQKEIMGLNLKSIEEIPVHLRHHCSLTISVDKKRLEDIKERINSLLEDLGNAAQRHGSPDEVYQFTLGFFPLTRMEK